MRVIFTYNFSKNDLCSCRLIVSVSRKRESCKAATVSYQVSEPHYIFYSPSFHTVRQIHYHDQADLHCRTFLKSLMWHRKLIVLTEQSSTCIQHKSTITIEDNGRDIIFNGQQKVRFIKEQLLLFLHASFFCLNNLIFNACVFHTIPISSFYNTCHKVEQNIKT